MLRKKIFLSIFLIVIFRILAHVPVPGVDLSSIRQFLSSNALFGFFDLFSGGGFQNFSIVTLGLGPYINASIIVQIFTAIVPSLEELSKEGEYGREKINQYTKFLTIPISFLQGYGMYFLLVKQGVIASMPFIEILTFILTLSAGSMIVTWLADLYTEKGLGNGVSIFVFVGIVNRLPLSAYQFFLLINAENFFKMLVFGLVALLVVVGVVLVNEAVRNIPIEYGRRFDADKPAQNKIQSNLPIKANQAGVIPIIFAVSLVLLPSSIASPLASTQNTFLKSIGEFLLYNFTPESILYNVVYFTLVVGFTFFYTSIQFNPQKIADDIKKRGGFIPGVRPGKNTQEYLKKIIGRITFIGAMFLGLIAVLPFVVGTSLGMSNLAIGGAGLLIVVSVVLETIRQIESHRATRSYENFLN